MVRTISLRSEEGTELFSGVSLLRSDPPPAVTTPAEPHAADPADLDLEGPPSSVRDRLVSEVRLVAHPDIRS
jgi:hypothetical protein